jgi:hypothetical protein
MLGCQQRGDFRLRADFYLNGFDDQAFGTIGRMSLRSAVQSEMVSSGIVCVDVFVIGNPQVAQRVGESLFDPSMNIAGQLEVTACGGDDSRSSGSSGGSSGAGCGNLLGSEASGASRRLLTTTVLQQQQQGLLVSLDLWVLSETQATAASTALAQLHAEPSGLVRAFVARVREINATATFPLFDTLDVVHVTPGATMSPASAPVPAAADSAKEHMALMVGLGALLACVLLALVVKGCCTSRNPDTVGIKAGSNSSINVRRIQLTKALPPPVSPQDSGFRNFRSSFDGQQQQRAPSTTSSMLRTSPQYFRSREHAPHQPPVPPVAPASLVSPTGSPFVRSPAHATLDAISPVRFDQIGDGFDEVKRASNAAPVDWASAEKYLRSQPTTHSVFEAGRRSPNSTQQEEQEQAYTQQQILHLQQQVLKQKQLLQQQQQQQQQLQANRQRKSPQQQQQQQLQANRQRKSPSQQQLQEPPSAVGIHTLPRAGAQDIGTGSPAAAQPVLRANLSANLSGWGPPVLSPVQLQPGQQQRQQLEQQHHETWARQQWERQRQQGVYTAEWKQGRKLGLSYADTAHGAAMSATSSTARAFDAMSGFFLPAMDKEAGRPKSSRHASM